MKRTAFGLLGCVFLVTTLSCTSDPREIVVTEEHEDNVLDVLGDETGLTVEEIGLLTSYQMRRGVAEALDRETEAVAGKTIGNLIEAEREFQAEEESRRVEQERLATEARAREEALAAELRGAILLAVYEKSFIASNPRANRYEDYIVVRTTYENTSGKDIRAFRVDTLLGPVR